MNLLSTNTIRVRLAAFILPLCIAPLASCESGGILRWASTGGGWRAQFACVGFANLFSQKLDILSQFSAISTNSGASWFSTQLFYSQEFYDSVVLAQDSQALYDFVVEWMDSYGNMLEDAIQNSTEMAAKQGKEVCKNVTDLVEPPEYIQTVSDLCQLLVYFNGDWALLVEKMLDAAATDFGDADFVNKLAGNENRLDAMKGTDLLIQAALVANSRVRGNDSTVNDIAVYVGVDDMAEGSNDSIYTVPISTAYVVDSTGTKYLYAAKSLDTDLTIQASPTSRVHSFEDWDDFYLYPTTANASDVIAGNNRSFGTLSAAFGGGDSSVVQVAAISSAAAGAYSPLAPSAFTQGESTSLYGIEENGTLPRLSAFETRVERMYDQTLLDGFAVCNQWPKKCGASDGVFVDGAFSDNPAFAINVGHYHIAGGDLGKTMKVILTNTNQDWPSDFQYTQMLQYFDSPINEGVAPGGFNWPPGMWVPYQSPQVFEEFMDSSMLDGLLEPISGSNMTMAILRGTTMDNPIFGIQAGQQVEILLINLNEPITTFIITPGLVQDLTEPLASMTKSIADNEELARRIQAFVDPAMSDGDHDDGTKEPHSTPAPVPGPPSPSSGHSVSGQYPAIAVLMAAYFSL